ncbi:MAG TPA: SLATT domain-containing protein [Pseudonocardiaceae bacterium]|nr:SLATT domain-containing protein [Pseudonocardiaceae bacterium]
MSDRANELLLFYREHRIVDQLNFYTRRKTQFDRAAGQAMALSAILLGFATAAGALAGTEVGPTWLWSILATVLPAAATSVGAYSILYAFEQQSKLYADAVRAVRAAARPATPTDPERRPAAEDPAELVKRVEAALRQEQAQWGQLTSQIQIRDDTRA